jgi:flagellar basal-body rod protein FlgB
MLDRLTNSLDFQAQALVLRAERQRLIASNMANGDTPGYVARDFDFGRALREAVGDKSAGGVSMSATQSGHLGIGGQPAGSGPQPQLNYATAAQTNLDSNTVDMDRERANFADNTVRYEATLRFINSQVRTMLSAISGQG